MNTRRSILAAVLALACLFAVNSFAQDKAKGKAKSYNGEGGRLDGRDDNDLSSR